MNKLEQYIKQNDLKKVAVARRLGISDAHLRNLRKGDAKPSPSLAKLIEIETEGAVPETEWGYQ